jgi:hypothetical protein
LLSPVAQPVPHLLCEQTWLAVQAVPHAPQFFGSDVVSAQVPLQFVRPVAHTHALALHIWPTAHDIPHALQLAASVDRS